MSCDKWFYRPDICDGSICVGDCDLCSIPKNPEKYIPGFEESTADEYEAEIVNARKGEE